MDIIIKKKLLKNFIKGLKNINQTELKIEKLIKKNDDKWYVRWKGCDN